jgi:hypothetical protein
MSWLKRLFGSKARPPTAPAPDDAKAYHNPVDGKTYVAEGGWRQHEPRKQNEALTSGPVALKEVRFLSSDQDFGANVSTESLARFIRDVHSRVQTHLGSCTRPAELLVQYTLHPEERPQVSMAAKGALEQKQLQKVHEALETIEPLHSRAVELSFQIHFLIAQGS